MTRTLQQRMLQGLLLTVLALTAAAAGMGMRRLMQDAPKIQDRAPNEPDQPTRRLDALIEGGALGASISAKDPFGLRRDQPLNAVQAGLSPPSAGEAGQTIEWHLGALSISPNERWLLLTAKDQLPLRISEGGKLPNGELVKRIDVRSVLLQDPKGRQRTLHLTTP